MGIAEGLAEKIKERRRELHLSQREAAELVGVSERTWQNWESGDSFPWPRHRRALDAFFSEGPVAA
jgi:transcriptional regulator with XRE-family HTH domain